MPRTIRRLFRNFGSLVAMTLLLILTFSGIGFLTLSVIAGGNLALSNESSFDFPTPQRAEAAIEYLGTSDPSAKIPFKTAALGFELEYPRSWQKNDRGLEVVFSPSSDGLDPAELKDAAIWFGIPTDNLVDPVALLTQLRTRIAPTGEVTSVGKLMIGDQIWHTADISFDNELLAGQATAKIAATTKDEVGYYAVAVAPSEEWPQHQPLFSKILDSFDFTAEAVLRPTSATMPPTPTATPTPIVYVVQSGDTLLYVAATYGIDLDILANRNGIDDPGSLQVGEKLIIPLRRR